MNIFTTKHVSDSSFMSDMSFNATAIVYPDIDSMNNLCHICEQDFAKVMQVKRPAFLSPVY